jgi:hypothetical protein
MPNETPRVFVRALIPLGGVLHLALYESKYYLHWHLSELCLHGCPDEATKADLVATMKALTTARPVQIIPHVVTEEID